MNARSNRGVGWSGTEEMIGGIAEGALVARVAEPDHGESGDGDWHEANCLNCGTAPMPFSILSGG